MKYLTTNKQLSWRDICARTAILNYYKKMGESIRSIDKIEKEFSILANAQYKIAGLVPNYLDRLLHIERTRSHHIVRLVDHDDFQLALHFIPSQYSINGHLHPDLINIIHVQQGELQIEQRSLTNQEGTFYRTLKENQSCAGLLKLRNIHHIKTGDFPCVFLSFRLSKKISHVHTTSKIVTMLASGSLFLLPNIITQNSGANEQVLLYSSHHTLNVSPRKLPNKNVIRANKLRTGNSITKDLYESTILYQQEAKKGNAEAQYWLGVMYLDGSGITEDSDEALHWIAMSSNQNYPPAEKLLNHLLTREEIPDC